MLPGVSDGHGDKGGRFAAFACKDFPVVMDAALTSSVLGLADPGACTLGGATLAAALVTAKKGLFLANMGDSLCHKGHVAGPTASWRAWEATWGR